MQVEVVRECLEKLSMWAQIQVTGHYKHILHMEAYCIAVLCVLISHYSS